MVALLPSFQVLATFCTLAFAAPASHLATRGTRPHTHNVRSLPNGLQMRSYHPSSTFELYGRGVDHPLSKRADTTPKEAGMSFMTDKLGASVTWKSGFARNDTTGLHHVFATQSINNITVVNSVANVAIKDNKVVSFSSNFINSTNVASATPKLTAEEATASAVSALSATTTGQNCTLKYYALEDNSLVLTHAVNLKTSDGHTVRAFVNAESGELVGMHDFTSHLTLRASPLDNQDPSKAFELLKDVEDLTVSPNGWTNFEGQETGELLGNNAASTLNLNTDDIGAESATDTFDFTPDFTVDPTTDVNVNASRTNAFFVVNTAHDIYYHYGFTEASFNFQDDNFGKGGAANDLVIISVQDQSGVDNAQFTAQEDGVNGVMQMFLFDTANPERDGALVNSVVAHEMTHGLSNRLTGGGTADCLQTLEAGGLGEGWSDAFAEWTEQTSGSIVDYTLAEFLFAGGIRTHPYSSNKTTNPLLFSDVAQLNEVHDIGEVWAETLHIVHDNLVQANGFSTDANTNPDGTGGNVIFLHLFVDQLALQPCNPTFLDARAAWIQADVNRFNGTNACTLWAGFAVMGLGPDASEGVDDFNTPASCGGTGSETASTGTGTTAATTTGDTTTATTHHHHKGSNRKAAKATKNKFSNKKKQSRSHRH